MVNQAVRAGLAGLLALAPACLDDNPSTDTDDGDGTGTGSSDGAGTSADDGEDGTGTGDTGGDDGGPEIPWPAGGMIGCAAGESCTMVFVAEAMDDRVDIYAARGGDKFRGSIDLDVKPNPGGDNTGQNLDEPYGMDVTADGLHVTVGHYPARDSGSLVTFPLEFLAGYDVGAVIPRADFFAMTAFVDPVSAIGFEEEEAIFVRRHPSGRLVIAVFNNDLFAPRDQWTNEGKLLILDPATGVFAAHALDGCNGAWGVTALDNAVDAVAVACDGNGAVAIIDTSKVGDGSVQDAADGLSHCSEAIPFPGKKIRALARDGHGGVIVAETPPLADGSSARLWRYDGDCAMPPGGGFGTLEGPTIWDIRMLEILDPSGPYWLMAKAKGDDRGVRIVDGSGGAPIVCGRIAELDDHWHPAAGGPIDPHGIALTRDRTGLVVGAGPDAPPAAGAGHGRVLWADLDVPADPCDTTATVDDLTASGPDVIDGDPSTWHRAPDIVMIHEVEG